MKYIKYIKYILLIIITLVSLVFIVKDNKVNQPNKLMIIVHPEDGLIWGGNELSKGNYLVVCVTCNKNNKDFIRIMNKMNNQYVLLSYDEDTEFIEENNILNRDLEYYINKYDWNKIITHNSEGEYGSIQHKIVSNKVSNIVKDKSKLFYFNKYYVESEFKQEKIKYYRLTDNELELKLKYISMLDDIEYVSIFKHIIPYEGFVRGDNNE